jgi:hypothetical protein
MRTSERSGGRIKRSDVRVSNNLFAPKAKAATLGVFMSLLTVAALLRPSLVPHSRDPDEVILAVTTTKSP